jgi:small-conductance mechanosensitive channel
MAERRILFVVGVTYQTPGEKLQRIPTMVREIIEGQKDTRFDRSHFRDFGDFSLNFETVYYVLSPDYGKYMDTQHAINLAIYAKFAEEGIDFAYPTRTLFIEQGGSANGNDHPKAEKKGVKVHD